MGGKTGDHWFRIVKLLKSITLIVNLTDYPKPLLKKSCGNKRTVDIKYKFIKSEFIFFK